MNHAKPIMVVTVTFLIFASTTQALAGKITKREERAKQLKERLITLRNWELMEEFDLKGQKAQKVFSILSQFDRERQDLIIKRRRLISQLRDALETGDRPDKEIKDLIKGITQCNVDLAKIPKKELKALEEVFNPRELARYLLFSQRFARQARRLLGRSNKKR